MKKNNNNYFFYYLNFIKDISRQKLQYIYKNFDSNSKTGLTLQQVFINRKIYGNNVFLKGNKKNNFQIIIRFLFNPFNIILFVMLFISLLTDVLFCQNNLRDYTTIITISLIFIFSNIINLFPEIKSSKILEKLKKMVQTTTKVIRDNKVQEIFSDDLVRGDIVFFHTGDIIPADIRLIKTDNFFVHESSLTGEANAVQKDSKNEFIFESFLEDKRLVFMGSNVISGYAKGIVVATGKDTYLGIINKNINNKKSFSNFQIGMHDISKLLVYLIFIMMPLMFFINYFKSNTHNIMESLIFSLTIAFGLTPEMLPLITTTSLSAGMISLSKHNLLVKNLSSIQDFGVMNILFTDKTGTLTEGHVSLDNYLDLTNNTNTKILKYSYLNSLFQTGPKNVIDDSIVNKAEHLKNNFSLDLNYATLFKKIYEIPFDYSRRIVSVWLEEHKSTKIKVVSKGAIEEILEVCTHLEIKNEILPLTNYYKKYILDQTIYYNENGFRVIGIAKKNIFDNKKSFKEEGMVFIGFLTFFDLVKKSAKKTILSLKQNGVNVKILTGDNEILTKTVARMVNIDSSGLMSGYEMQNLSDDELYEKSQKISIFFKLSPEQKSRIIEIFKNKGNTVGFMGDGINDVPAMQKSNLSIAVSTGADITKEVSDIIMLENDLNVLQQGILEGRKSYNNMLKYLKFTLASNFGNVLSVCFISLFFGFMPIKAIQILFLNLIYDFTCLSIPFDNVDSNYLKKPNIWNLKNIFHFMLFFGFISFLFDVLFFTFLSIYINQNKTFISQTEIIFQTGWFIFSMWSQVFMIYLLRTNNILKEKKPSFWMFISSFIGLIIVTISPLMGFLIKSLKLKKHFFSELPLFPLIFIFILMLYFIFVIIAKKIFIKKNNNLI